MKNIENKLWTGFGIMFLFFALLWTCSCSVQQVAYRDLTPPDEDLFEFNENDYKVVSFEFPYAEVLLPDSTVKYIYCPYCSITGPGYLISDRK